MWNGGQTCFLNALAQCLRAVCVRLQLNIPEATTCPLAPLLRVGLLDREDFLRMVTAVPVWKPKGAFILGRQQDSHELARVLLDSAHAMHQDCAPGACVATMLEDVFRVNLANELLCTRPLCMWKSSPPSDKAQDIQLQLSVASPMEDLLQTYEAEEFLDADGDFACELCKGLVQKRLRIQPAGTAVMFHLKRFSFAAGGRKLHAHVSFPQILPLNGQIFEFAGVVTHSGRSLECGHYTACVDTGRLYRCDDSSVSRCDWLHVAEQQAYLLVYTKVCARFPLARALASSIPAHTDATTTQTPLADDSQRAQTNAVAKCTLDKGTASSNRSSSSKSKPLRGAVIEAPRFAPTDLTGAPIVAPVHGPVVVDKGELLSDHPSPAHGQGTATDAGCDRHPRPLDITRDMLSFSDTTSSLGPDDVSSSASGIGNSENEGEASGASSSEHIVDRASGSEHLMQDVAPEVFSEVGGTPLASAVREAPLRFGGPEPLIVPVSFGPTPLDECAVQIPRRNSVDIRTNVRTPRIPSIAEMQLEDCEEQASPKANVPLKKLNVPCFEDMPAEGGDAEPVAKEDAATRARNVPRFEDMDAVDGDAQPMLKFGADGEVEVAQDDEWSDVSDNSDIFHVSAKPSQVSRTDEDEDLRIVESIVPYLREYPLLPADGADPENKKSFTEVSSAMRLPLLHCGFRGCSWTSNADFPNHWSMEMVMFQHLQAHRAHELKEVPHDAWPATKVCTSVDGSEEHKCKNYAFDVVAYYLYATRIKEQEHVPIIGPSLDRRQLALLNKAMNSSTVQGLICFSCANVRTWVKQWEANQATHGAHEETDLLALIFRISNW